MFVSACSRSCTVVRTPSSDARCTPTCPSVASPELLAARSASASFCSKPSSSRASASRRRTQASRTVRSRACSATCHSCQAMPRSICSSDAWAAARRAPRVTNVRVSTDRLKSSRFVAPAAPFPYGWSSATLNTGFGRMPASMSCARPTSCSLRAATRSGSSSTASTAASSGSSPSERSTRTGASAWCFSSSARTLSRGDSNSGRGGGAVTGGNGRGCSDAQATASRGVANAAAALRR